MSQLGSFSRCLIWELLLIVLLITCIVSYLVISPVARSSELLELNNYSQPEQSSKPLKMIYHKSKIKNHHITHCTKPNIIAKVICTL